MYPFSLLAQRTGREVSFIYLVNCIPLFVGPARLDRFQAVSWETTGMIFYIAIQVVLRSKRVGITVGGRASNALKMRAK